MIPVPSTTEEEEAQVQATLQRSVVERRASNVPYLEGVSPFAFELQQRELEVAAKRKAEMEAVMARGEGTFAQESRTLAQGAEASRNEVRPT